MVDTRCRADPPPGNVAGRTPELDRPHSNIISTTNYAPMPTSQMVSPSTRPTTMLISSLPVSAPIDAAACNCSNSCRFSLISLRIPVPVLLLRLLRRHVSPEQRPPQPTHALSPLFAAVTCHWLSPPHPLRHSAHTSRPRNTTAVP